MVVINRSQLKSLINLNSSISALLENQREALVGYSQNRILCPPSLQLDFKDEQGDCHIKAAAQVDGDFFSVKCATGFYRNTEKGLKSGDGVFLLFCQKTGILEMILHDEGWLTTLRTALSALIFYEMTPWEIKNIGIVGHGQVSQMLIKLLKFYSADIPVHIWTRNPNEKNKLKAQETSVQICTSINELIRRCDVIFTATPSQTSLVNDFGLPRQHFIAIGADGENKQELSPHLFGQADNVYTDSCQQATRYGDSSYAIKQNYIGLDNLKELGVLIHKSQSMIGDKIISDLTGIAAQDLCIAQQIKEIIHSSGSVKKNN